MCNAALVMGSDYYETLEECAFMLFLIPCP